MKKNTLVLLIIPIMALSLHGAALAPGTTIESFWSSPTSTTFSDLQNHAWAQPHINNLSKYGIINGYTVNGSSLFHPANHMTRAEFSKIVISAFGAYQADASADMFDNPRESWAYPYISSAVTLGIAQGYSSEFFGANDNILRQDVAVLLKRTIDHAQFTIPQTNTKINYSDANEIQNYAKPAVEYFAQRGIFKGDEQVRFNPNNYAERAEIAVLIDRILTNGSPE